MCALIVVSSICGNTHSGSYDALRRLTTYTAPSGTGASTTWTHNSDGLITQIARANGSTPAVTTYTYWPTARVKTMIDPDGRVTRYDYDAANRPTYATDPELRRTLKIYDAASQVIEERRAVGTVSEQADARFTYTPNGKQASIKDAKNNQTAYTYNDFDRLWKTTFPDSTFEQLAYDTVDNVTSKVTRGGQTITNVYDSLNRLTTHTVPQVSPTAAIVTTTVYDLAGRTLSTSDTTGQGLTCAFDSAKRAISVTQAAQNVSGTRVVSYELDNAGNKTKAIWADGYFVSYQFDALNRMTVATEGGTFVLATYVYDSLSRRASLVYGNGTTQAYTYSTGGDLLAHAHTLSGASNTWTNTYTKAHQLLTEVASNAFWGFQPALSETTTYGAANNLNQYVTVTQGANPTVTLSYDANGNLTSDSVWSFAYDAENRLKLATSSTTTASYAYDPLGRRQAKTVNGTTTSFLSDGDEEIAEYDGAGGLLRRYVPGPGTDQPIAMVTPSGGSNIHAYFHANRQGSTVAMSNDAGTVSEGPYTYDASGNGAPSTGVPFKYTGRRLDAETGLYYYRARYYSASLGRFLQTDPIGYGAGLNLYAYASNDAINRFDPSGLADLVLFNIEDKLRPAAQDFDVEGMFTVFAHGNANYAYNNQLDPKWNSSTQRDVTQLSREIGLAGHHPGGYDQNGNFHLGETIFLAICHSSEYAQELANLRGSIVYATDGYSFSPSDGYHTGNPIKISVNSSIDNKGTPGSYQAYVPDAFRACYPDIKSITLDPNSGIATIEYVGDPSSVKMPSSRPRSVTVCTRNQGCKTSN